MRNYDAPYIFGGGVEEDFGSVSDGLGARMLHTVECVVDVSQRFVIPFAIVACRVNLVFDPCATRSHFLS